MILKSIQKCRVLYFSTKSAFSREAIVRAPLKDLGHSRVDHETDLRDVDVLLEVQQPHLQLSDLLLLVGGHLVPDSVRLATLPHKALEVGRHGCGDI